MNTFSSRTIERIRYITPNEFKKLLDYVKTQDSFYYYAFLICGNLGLRVGELNELRVKDFDIVNNLVKIKTEKQKTKKPATDTIELNPELARLIKPFLADKEPDDLLFPMSTRQIQRKFDEFAGKVNLKIKGGEGIHGRGIHCLRHLRGLILATKTHDPYVIARLLRHRSLNTSLVYVHLTNIEKTVKDVGIIK